MLCHGGAFEPQPGSDPAAPTWPPPVAPVWPFQFESEVYGWYLDDSAPSGMNVTGSWHYDFPNNRMALYYTGHPGNENSSGTPQNVTFLWIANPTPMDELPAEELYGKGAQRGNFYVFIKPTPSSPFSCGRIPYPFPIVHPDIMSSRVMRDQDVTFVGREQVDGNWSDHYYFNFSAPGCLGPVDLWKNVYDHTPMRTYHLNDCLGGRASNTWRSVKRQEPPISLWQGWDFSICDFAADMSTFKRRMAPAGGAGLLLDTALAHLPQERVWSDEFAVL